MLWMELWVFGVVAKSDQLISYLCYFYTHLYNRQLTICDAGSRIFVFDYGGTLLHKERYDIYIKQTLSAIDGRKPSGE